MIGSHGVHQKAPITPNDRVSDVLARDEALVEVFARQAPQFAKLRNRAMRSVMARLVTVEQAARMANVLSENLVKALNDALGLVSQSATPGPAAARDAGEERSGVHPTPANVIEVDVREDLRSGREPFSKIMGAVGALAAGDVLHLRAIFEPVPLFAVLAKRGFAHESKAHAPDDWSVWFWRPATPDALPEEASTTPEPDGDVPADDETTTYLDVRGLGPPEPMMRTLVALETLQPGRTLVQINSRVPQFLLPVLTERGFAWEIDDSREDRVIVRICHEA